MKISYSAPAKVILCGEHSVVYGKPALVSAIDLRITCALSENHEKNNNVEKLIKRAIQQKTGRGVDPKYHLKIDSKIPVGRGLGSSAAIAVAGSAVFLHTLGIHDKETVNNVAYAVEKVFHKNPSGVDSTTSCFGGLVYFRKEFEFLKGIYKLNMKLPKNFTDSLFLVDSGKPKESTADMVAHVGMEYNKNPVMISDLCNNLEKVTKRMVVSITKEDRNLFKSSIEEAEINIEKLGIVSDSTKKLVSELGVIGTAKVTGAGGLSKGSGYLLVLVDNEKEFKNYCTTHSITYLKFEQSEDGYRQE